MRVHRRRQRRLGHAATKHRACMQRGMQSVCNQYAISMQSVCNQHVIIWCTFGRVVPPSEADDDVAEKG